MTYGPGGNTPKPGAGDNDGTSFSLQSTLKSRQRKTTSNTKTRLSELNPQVLKELYEDAVTKTGTPVQVSWITPDNSKAYNISLCIDIRRKVCTWQLSLLQPSGQKLIWEHESADVLLIYNLIAAESQLSQGIEGIEQALVINDTQQKAQQLDQFFVKMSTASTNSDTSDLESITLTPTPGAPAASAPHEKLKPELAIQTEATREVAKTLIDYAALKETLKKDTTERALQLSSIVEADAMGEEADRNIPGRPHSKKIALILGAALLLALLLAGFAAYMTGKPQPRITSSTQQQLQPARLPAATAHSP